MVGPDEDQCEAVIRSYYEYAIEKERALRGEEYDQKVEDWYKYQTSIEALREKDLFYVSEQLFRDVSTAMGWDEVRALFDLDENIRNPTITDPKDIERLVKLMRNAKRTLQDEKPDVNWELTLEPQAIALCEFALEHGYEVELSLG